MELGVVKLHLMDILEKCDISYLPWLPDPFWLGAGGGQIDIFKDYLYSMKPREKIRWKHLRNNNTKNVNMNAQ